MNLNHILTQPDSQVLFKKNIANKQDVYLTVTMLIKARQFKGFIKLICGVDALEVYFLQINLQITANENNDELT